MKAGGQFLTIIMGWPMFLLLFSCSKSPDNRPIIMQKANTPSMSARNIEILFSDSGKIQAKITSPLLNRYNGDHPYLEFPEGFRVLMYDSIQRISSTISGDRGIRRENERIMEAWGNVIIRNIPKQEELTTGHLVWDEPRRKIWSDTNVAIRRPDQVIYGSSLESDDTFNRYTITEMSGEMMVHRDSI